MKIREFMKTLYYNSVEQPAPQVKTCDVFKVGDPECEVRKVAAAMFGTPDVIRSAAKWGANLLIVHEPLFYEHWDDPEELNKLTGLHREIIEEKRKLLRETGMTVYRWHDHPHHNKHDYIAVGFIQYSGLQGTWCPIEVPRASRLFDLDQPMSAKELAANLKEKLNCHYIRIFGSPDTLCKRLSLCCGTPGNLVKSMEKSDAMILGEICEWEMGEMMRDYVQLNMGKKAILVLGHCGSERAGMRYLADTLIPEWFPGIEAKYFDSGEVYA